MNTWDINLATCTAIEDKHEANSPPRGTVAGGTRSSVTANATAAATSQQYSEQSQIPTTFVSTSKLSYRNLIFGSGRRQKNVSERMRAQESLFSSQREEEADMSAPPKVMYANSNVFYNKSLLAKTTSFDDEEKGGAAGSAGLGEAVPGTPGKTSIFDIMSHSRIWQELNNSASAFHTQNMAAYNAYGYEKYCHPDSNGTLNQEAMDTLKAMAYFGLGNKTLVGHEVLLEVQCGGGGHQDGNVPPHWMELRSLCTIEIINYVMEELIRDELVEAILCNGDDTLNKISLESVYYRKRIGGSLGQQRGNAAFPSILSAPGVMIDQRSSCLKIRKPWKE